jgi:hypothetical protein
MTTLAIDQHEAQRLIASILRDNGKLLPAQANAISDMICRRILATMPQRARSWQVRNWRAIDEYPPTDCSDIISEMRRYVPNADEKTVSGLWHAIYKVGRDIPLAAAAKFSEERS